MIYIFRDHIRSGLEDVAKDFVAFGRFVGTALTAVWKIITTIAQKIYEALQYINPFARHSPSLVDNVKAGVATILDEYGKLSGIGGLLRSTLAEIEAFGRATDNIAVAGSSASRAKDREDLVGLGASDEALAIFDSLTNRMRDLRASLPGLQAEIDAQAVVVSRWAAELKKADTALEAAQTQLDGLERAAASARDELDAAKAVLDDLFTYGITGEMAASDAIFNNEMAIKALRLELLRLEESGQSIEDVADQMAKLTGEIEKMQAIEKDLRLAGAGSEITGPIRAQIDALEAQRKAMASGAGGTSRGAEIQKQIDMLEKQGEMLELERSLKFDPLRRQLDALKDTYNEMPFDQLVNAIRDQQAEVNVLTERYDTATMAVEEQRRVVEDLSDARKAIAAVYDLEADKLSQLKEAYDEVTQAIEAANSAVSALKESGGAGGGIDLGAEGDFPVPGGSGAIGREGGLADIEQLVKDYAAEFKSQFDKYDIFDGLKKKWEDFRNFITTWKDRWSGFWDEMGQIMNTLSNAFDVVRGKVETAWNWISEKTGNFVSAFLDSIKPITDELAKWGELFQPFLEAVGNVIKITLPFLAIFASWFKETFELIWEITKVLWDSIVKAVAGALEIMRGVINVILGILTGDWDRVWKGIKGIFSGIWTEIESVWVAASGLFTKIIPEALDGLKNVFSTVFGEIKNIVSGVWGEIQQLAASGVNGVIGVVNGLIDGINAVMRGIGLGNKQIGKIGKVHWGSGAGGVDSAYQGPAGHYGVPAFAGGGITNGPMALVGEGRRAYPEFVIPTDPRYRSNALHLMGQAIQAVGMPKMAPGGIVGLQGIGDIVGGIGETIEDGLGAIRKAAVMATFAPFLKAFDIGLSALPNGGLWDMMKGSANYLKNEAYNWAKGAANGAIVGARPGGHIMRLGERGYAEAVIPLDMARHGMGGTTVVINGDLSFPNIENGNDAELFIKNLKTLAG
jgi:hypothetical protein